MRQHIPWKEIAFAKRIPSLSNWEGKRWITTIRLKQPKCQPSHLHLNHFYINFVFSNYRPILFSLRERKSMCVWERERIVQFSLSWSLPLFTCIASIHYVGRGRTGRLNKVAARHCNEQTFRQFRQIQMRTLQPTYHLCKEINNLTQEATKGQVHEWANSCTNMHLNRRVQFHYNGIKHVIPINKCCTPQHFLHFRSKLAAIVTDYRLNSSTLSIVV